MTPEQALGQLNLIRDLIPAGSSNRPGKSISPTFVTIHNTDNTAKTADARAHGRYLRGEDARKRKVSWHFTVDDKCVVQSLPMNEMGWHAASGPGNATSIGVEICVNEGLDETAAYERAALLVAWICKSEHIPIDEAIKQHHDWSGKNCPKNLRKPGAWKAFCKRAIELHQALVGGDVDTDVHEGLHHDAPGAMKTPKAKSLPISSPVEFAASATAARSFWPIVSAHPQATTVSCEMESGEVIGNPYRAFLAPRQAGERLHVGVDLYANEGDEVIACEDGKIVAFFPFYRSRSSAEVTFALLVQHEGFVINYGEVHENSLAAHALNVGDEVKAGHAIARVGTTSMLHFEMYANGAVANLKWLDFRPAPDGLLNPTQYLLELAAHGVRLAAQGRARPGSIQKRGTKVKNPHLVSAGAQVLEAPVEMPKPGVGDWRTFNSGLEWRYDQRGVFTKVVQPGAAWRTTGSPSMVRRAWSLTAPILIELCTKHSVNPALALMVMATETSSLSPDTFTGARSFRWGPGEIEATAAEQGDWRGGPMQVRASRARQLIRQHGRAWKLPYDASVVAASMAAAPSDPPEDLLLYDYRTNLDLGLADIRSRLKITGDNPILVAAAYSAGDVVAPPAGEDVNVWRMYAYRDYLDRAAKWYGDACAVLTEAGVI